MSKLMLLTFKYLRERDIIIIKKNDNNISELEREQTSDYLKRIVLC